MKKFILLILAFVFIIKTNIIYGQIRGCTDPKAINYNNTATQNDGSCKYNITIYNPPFRFFLPEETHETSGLIFYNNGYWTMNDSGGLPVLYKLDTVTGEVVQRISITDATNVDWEDLAQDSLFIYIGDFGNNSGNRDDLCIYKVKKHNIPAYGDDSVKAGKIGFVFEDYKGHVEKRKENNFDCEAFMAIGDSLYIFSKDWQDQRTRMYRIPKTIGNYTAKLLYNFNSKGLITAADYNNQYNEISLLGYTNKSWIPFVWILWNYNGHDFFSGNKRRIDMPNVTATQTEGITYVNGKRAVISSEGRTLFKQTMYNFSTAKWTNKTYAGIEKNNKPEFNISLYPNPLKKNNLHIKITHLKNFNFQIAVFDSSGKQILEKSYNLKRKGKYIDIKIKLRKIASGVYVVRFISANLTLEKTFIKK